MSDDETPIDSSAGEPGSSHDGVAPLPGQSGGATAAAPTKRGGFVRRHKLLLALGLVLVVIAASAGGYLYWLDTRLTAVSRIPVDIIEEDPKKDHGGEKDQPLNILLLGADNGNGTESVEADLKDGKWTPFIHRSDTMMIAHIPADRKSVQLVSIPRDTWVPIKDYPTTDSHAKINAAFAFGGPSVAVDTVEKLTGMSIDHLAIIDWDGFKDLTTNLGGVRVYIPEAFYDSSQRIPWDQGWQTLKGQLALAYVRTRYDLPDESGDFGRIARQQNFLRATMGQLLSSSHNIITMTKVLNGIVKYLTIDDSWDNDEIRNLALSLRSLHASDVDFLTAPLGSYDTVDGQSIVRLAPKQSQRLFDDVDGDNIQDYLDRYPDAKLDDDRSID